MNIVELKKNLICAARRLKAEDRVPYAFEKRIMARIGSLPKVDLWSLWSRALWRAAAPCVALTLVLAFWSFYSTQSASSSQARVVELEHAVLAPLDTLGELQ